MSIKNERELMFIAIEMNNTIQQVKDFYPVLAEFNAIKRLISISDKWDKIFTESYSSKDGGI